MICKMNFFKIPLEVIRLEVFLNQTQSIMLCSSFCSTSLIFSFPRTVHLISSTGVKHSCICEIRDKTEINIYFFDLSMNPKKYMKKVKFS